MRCLWKIAPWGEGPGPAGVAAAGVIAFAGAQGLMFPPKEVKAGHRTWLGPAGPWIQVCSGAQHRTRNRASYEDISPSCKTKNMGPGATVIYFGDRLYSGLDGDPQNVGSSLNLYISTCEWDLIWKMVFA